MKIRNTFNYKEKAWVCILSLLMIDIAFHSQAIARESLNNLRDDISELQNQDQQTASQLVITGVHVDENRDTLVINGVNFDNGDLPVTELGGQDLVVIRSDGLQIVADLPLSFNNASYILTVSTGLQRSQFDSFDLTLDVVGLQGLQGSVGSIGSRGPSGPQGQEGRPGIQGSQGLQGAIGSPGLRGFSLLSRQPISFPSVLVPGRSQVSVPINTVNFTCPDGEAALSAGFISSGNVVATTSERRGRSSWRFTFFNFGNLETSVSVSMNCTSI